MRTLSLRELNRATLARQLLLERKRLGPVAAIERLAGLQAQWPPSPYVGLWSRLAGFRRETLERAILAGEVVKATVMRGTLHLLAAREYPTYFAALRETTFWGTRVHLGHALKAVPGVRELAREASIGVEDALRYLEREHGHADIEARRVFHVLRRHAHLLPVPENALWSTRPGVRYRAHPQPEEVDLLTARIALVRRYLAAFGPARRADVAEWSGLRVADLADAIEVLEPLRRYRDEQGRELLDLRRAPLPPADAPAPVRFLPKWDNLLLAHADRRRVLPDDLRNSVIGKNGDVAQTFLVDGVVAGTWSADRSRRVSVAPFAPLPRAARSEVEEEAARLEAWLR